MTPLPCDVTQLARDPTRTGIQRVARAALRHWPGPRPLLPCRFDPAAGGLVPLPDAAVALLREDTAEGREMPVPALREAVAAAIDAAPASLLPPDALRRVLVPELFYDRARCEHYLGPRYPSTRHPDVGRPGDDPAAGPSPRTAGDGPRFLAFDFIPWLRPELLDLAGTHGLMFYLAVLRRHAGRVAFISEATRRDFADRILRGDPGGRSRPAGPGQPSPGDAPAYPARAGVPDPSAPDPPPPLGPVLPLGADGLASLPGVARQQWHPSRDLVLALGSVDGRKNQHLVAAAVRRLRATGGRLRLAVVGGVFPNALAQEQARALAALAEADPDGISHHPRLDDPALAALLERTRATAYASAAEGFGLPPLEGLALGIPALAPRGLPSLPDGGENGVLRLDSFSEDALGRALAALADDARAARLWREAASLRPPGWREFGAALGRWAQE